MGATQAAMLQAKPGAKGAATPKGVVVVPFTRASHKVIEGTFADVAITPGASAKGGGGPYDVPARGYASALWVLVEATGGVLGTANLLEDAPFSFFANPSFGDPAGVEYFGNGLQGFDWMLANKYGAYVFNDDPTVGPGVSLASINFGFALRIPIQVTDRDAFGSLLNEDAAASFQFDFGVNSLADLVDVPANLTTAPSVRTRAWLEAWADPRAQAADGTPQAGRPPGFGNAQYWSAQVYPINAGLNTIKLKKTGLLVRDLILIYRDSTGARSDVDFPETFTFNWNSRGLFTAVHRTHIKRMMYERFGVVTPETGVFVLDYMSDGDGHAGDELRNLYLPTKTATRLELQGVFGDTGTLTVLTNDIGAVGNPYTAPV